MNKLLAIIRRIFRREPANPPKMSDIEQLAEEVPEGKATVPSPEQHLAIPILTNGAAEILSRNEGGEVLVYVTPNSKNKVVNMRRRFKPSKWKVMMAERVTRFTGTGAHADKPGQVRPLSG